MADAYPERRKRTLTDEDLDTLADMLRCQKCAFSPDEVAFVKGWLDTAKTAKSEVIKWIVKMFIITIGLMCGLWVAIKMDLFKIVKG